MKRYGRRYYDGFCLVCVTAKRSVKVFRGVCLSCLVKRMLLLPAMVLSKKI